MVCNLTSSHLKESPHPVPLSNTGESMVVGPERIDQTPPKSQAFKPAEGLSPIGVKKDGSNLPAHFFF